MIGRAVSGQLLTAYDDADADAGGAVPAGADVGDVDAGADVDADADADVDEDADEGADLLGDAGALGDKDVCTDGDGDALPG